MKIAVKCPFVPYLLPTNLFLRQCYSTLTDKNINNSNNNSSDNIVNSQYAFLYGASGLPKRKPKSLPIKASFLSGSSIGDDALYTCPFSLGVADGVGSWNLKQSGFPSFWSRSLLHYTNLALQDTTLIPTGNIDINNNNNSSNNNNNNNNNNNSINHSINSNSKLNIGKSFLYNALKTAYDHTRINASVLDYRGTTTCTIAYIYSNFLNIISIGDSRIWVLRHKNAKPFSSSYSCKHNNIINHNYNYPPDDDNIDNEDELNIVYTNTESWHWFDCPYQLGTNSLDTIEKDAIFDSIQIYPHDIIILSSDGLSDNLWDHEIVSTTMKGLSSEYNKANNQHHLPSNLISFNENQLNNFNISNYYFNQAKIACQATADLLCERAYEVASNPYGDSPFMERAVMEGLSFQGGKLDDISVIVAQILPIS